MKTYVHARLTRADRAALETVKAATGHSESEVVRLGVSLAAETLGKPPSAADLAGTNLSGISSDIHAGEDYRRAMIRVFTRRALEGARARASA